MANILFRVERMGRRRYGISVKKPEKSPRSYNVMELMLQDVRGPPTVWPLRLYLRTGSCVFGMHAHSGSEHYTTSAARVHGHGISHSLPMDAGLSMCPTNTDTLSSTSPRARCTDPLEVIARLATPSPSPHQMALLARLLTLQVCALLSRHTDILPGSISSTSRQGPSPLFTGKLKRAIFGKN